MVPVCTQMTNKQSLKETITIAVLSQLPDIARITVKDALLKWWMNIRKEGGLRLSAVGDLAFRQAEIEYYEYPFNLIVDGSIHSVMLELNKKIKCPYYMGVNKGGKKSFPYIRFYDSKIAMLVSLYGNVNEYLDSIKVKK